MTTETKTTERPEPGDEARDKAREAADRIVDSLMPWFHRGKEPDAVAVADLASRVAELFAERERATIERCAKVADAWHEAAKKANIPGDDKVSKLFAEGVRDGYAEAARAIATAISSL